MYRIPSILFLLIAALRLGAQTPAETLATHYPTATLATQTPAYETMSWDDLSGICKPYPDIEQPVTRPPGGYKPFYISHLGRHGSRLQGEEGIYARPLGWMEKADSAGVLTAEGREVLEAVRTLAADAEGCVGELSPVGEQEHRHIAERMYRHYPQVFRKRGGMQPFLDVQSSARMRSTLSGVFAAERLKELNPGIDVTRCAAPGNWEWIFDLRESGKVGRELRKKGWNTENRMNGKPVDGSRVAARLFTDGGAFLPAEDHWMFVHDLYHLAADTKASGFPEIDLFRYLDKADVFPIWERENARFYLRQCNSLPYGDRILKDGHNVLRRIIREADDVIAASPDGVHGAHLRYGHDQNVATLGALLRLEGCDARVSDYDAIKDVFRTADIVPMACNIQLVFFRKGVKDPVLVKILLNEREVRPALLPDEGPFYCWDDLRAAFVKLLGNR